MGASEYHQSYEYATNTSQSQYTMNNSIRWRSILSGNKHNHRMPYLPALPHRYLNWDTRITIRLLRRCSTTANNGCYFSMASARGDRLFRKFFIMRTDVTRLILTHFPMEETVPAADFITLDTRQVNVYLTAGGQPRAGYITYSSRWCLPACGIAGNDHSSPAAPGKHPFIHVLLDSASRGMADLIPSAVRY